LNQILGFYANLQQKFDFSIALKYFLGKLQQKSEKQDVKMVFWKAGGNVT